MNDPFHPDSLGPVLDAVETLLAELQAAVTAHADELRSIPPTRRPSAENLVHYLATRSHDLRPLQHELRRRSLSSLGRMEGDVRGTLAGVGRALRALLGAPFAPVATADLADGDRRLDRNAEELFGPTPANRHARIMVTLPREAAEQPRLLHDLLLAGMDLARINLAHDHAGVWTSMVANLQRACAETGRSCRVLADLPGPKLRTGDLAPGPEVLRVRPERDVFGRCTEPAIVVFHDPGVHPRRLAATTALVPLADELLRFAAIGDELVVTDTRGRCRSATVFATGDGWCETRIERTTYFGSGAEVRLLRGITELGQSWIGHLPPRPGRLQLGVGDTLLLTRPDTVGGPPRVLVDGTQTPARIPCRLEQVFADARQGQRILFDDGRITGVLTAVAEHQLTVRIEATPPGGGKLGTDQGINLPDTDLQVPALAAADHARLPWIAQHADLVGVSFAQRAEDLSTLQQELARLGRPDLGLLLKIETARGFQNLPTLLLAGMRHSPLGVMVARGDLAVEVGYGRLAEVQEEILWLCEAAHVPAVWATQVLDGMARTGQPSRAEITDAAMAVRAECVMLNKGPYVVDTVRFLGDVLRRMQEHTSKKRSLLRRLRVAGAPPPPPTGQQSDAVAR